MEGAMTTAEAATKLEVTPSAISYMVKRGELTPAMKLPGRRGAFLFDPASIEAKRKEKSDA